MPSIERLTPSQWMQQPLEIRTYLSQMWKIPYSGVTEIRDQTVLSDGHSYDDLKRVDLETMNTYIKSEETFGRAWELTCARAYSDLHPPEKMIQKPLEDNTNNHDKKNK